MVAQETHAITISHGYAIKDSPVTEFDDRSPFPDPASDVDNTEDYFGEASETDEANTPSSQRISNPERALSGDEDGRSEFEDSRDHAGSPNIGQLARSQTDPSPGVMDSPNLLVSRPSPRVCDPES